MLYSSGTTGRPKGILRALPENHPSEPLPRFRFVMAMFRMREGMTYLSPAPIYHSAPQASVACALRLGSTSVIMERFDPEQFMALIEQHRITHTQVVPTMFSRLLKLPAAVREKYDLSSLEVVIHAAAPCPVPVKQAMIDWLGPIIVEYYGATEGNGFTRARRPSPTTKTRRRPQRVEMSPASARRSATSDTSMRTVTSTSPTARRT
jgi:long-chain acyl-CoA synthetase